MEDYTRKQLEPYSQRGSPELESLNPPRALELFEFARDQLIFLEGMEEREIERVASAGGDDEPEPEPDLDFTEDRRFLETVRDNALERLARLQNRDEPVMNFLDISKFRLGGRGKKDVLGRGFLLGGRIKGEREPKIIWS